MNKTENLLASLTEECTESGWTACKAMRFGLDHIWPEKNETNRRILEREIADILGAAEELGLVIRREDIDAKRAKIRKYQALSVELGTLTKKSIPINEDDGSCPKCGLEAKDYKNGFISDGGDQEYNFTCVSCGEEFVILRRVIVAEYSVKDKS